MTTLATAPPSIISNRYSADAANAAAALSSPSAYPPSATAAASSSSSSSSSYPSSSPSLQTSSSDDFKDEPLDPEGGRMFDTSFIDTSPSPMPPNANGIVPAAAAAAASSPSNGNGTAAAASASSSSTLASKSLTDSTDSLFPFGDPTNRPYKNDESVTVQVRWVYRAVNFLTELFFGVDKDLDHLPEKRASVLPVFTTGAESLQTKTLSLLPPSISAGYGELSWQGFDKVCHYMQHQAPDDIRLNEKSRFLDIGSGFGKCVFHAKLRAKVARSVGIECIKTRHEKALESLHMLRAGYVPGLSDQKDAPPYDTVRNMDLSGCELFEGDCSLPKFHPLVNVATHIYAFDVVFSKDTHSKILPIVEQSNFKLFGCYVSPQKMAQFGCTRLRCIHTLKVHTTGKQSFTCYFYIKDLVPEKITRNRDPTSDAFWAELHEITATPEPYLLQALEERDNKRLGKGKDSPQRNGSANGMNGSGGGSGGKGKHSPNGHTPSSARSSSSTSPPSARQLTKEFYAAAYSSDNTSPQRNGHSKSKKKKKDDKKSKNNNQENGKKRSHKKKQPASDSSSSDDDDDEDDTSSDDESSKKKKGSSSSSGGSKKKKNNTSSSKKSSTKKEANGHSKASSSKKKDSHKKNKRKKEESEAEESEEEEEAAAEEEEPKPAGPKPKSRGQLFEEASRAALAPRKFAPRRTNNSLVVKLEPLVVSALPQELSHYLSDPVKEAEPILLTDEEIQAKMKREEEIERARLAGLPTAMQIDSGNGATAVAAGAVAQPAALVAAPVPATAAAAPVANGTAVTVASSKTPPKKQKVTHNK